MATLAKNKQIKNKQSSMRRLGLTIFYFILFVVLVIQIYTLIWLFFFSVKENVEIFGQSPFALPTEWRWDNYDRVWTEGIIGQYFFNSVFVTAVSVIGTVLLASFVTFAIRRMYCQLNNFVLLLFMRGAVIR